MELSRLVGISQISNKDQLLKPNTKLNILVIIHTQYNHTQNTKIRNTHGKEIFQGAQLMHYSANCMYTE